jgi:hypothetical protein
VRQTWQHLGLDGRCLPGLTAALSILFTVTVLAYFLALQPRAVSDGLANMSTSRRAAGVWLKENSPAGAMIMSRDTEVPFYAERSWAATPHEEYPRFISYVRKRGANYIVVDEREATVIRPQLSVLMDESSPPAGLEQVYTARDDQGKTVVYEVIY